MLREDARCAAQEGISPRTDVNAALDGDRQALDLERRHVSASRRAAGAVVPGQPRGERKVPGGDESPRRCDRELRKEVVRGKRIEARARNERSTKAHLEAPHLDASVERLGGRHVLGVLRGLRCRLRERRAGNREGKKGKEEKRSRLHGASTRSAPVRREFAVTGLVASNTVAPKPPCVCIATRARPPSARATSKTDAIPRSVVRGMGFKVLKSIDARSVPPGWNAQTRSAAIVSVAVPVVVNGGAVRPRRSRT